MKNIYLRLLIVSSLIIGTAANPISTTGIFSGEVQNSWTIGIPDVIVTDVDRCTGTVTDWGGEFSYARTDLLEGEIVHVLFSFVHPDYDCLTDVFPIKAGYEGYYNIRLTSKNDTR